MERGLTDPFLVMAEPIEGGNLVALVVKSRAGYRNRPEAMLRELFSLLLARGLGLLTPTPVWVDLPEGLAWAASEFPRHAELISRSGGWNLATIHLGTGWKPWTQAAAPRSISSDDMENAFAFDAMVQNADREADNPNLLWRGSELALLDFDKAFDYLRVHEAEPRPWRQTLGLQGLRRHCLFRHLPQFTENQLVGTKVWDSLEEWRLEHQPGQISDEIREILADPDMDLPRIEAYFKKLAVATEDFFSFLTATIRR